MSELTRCNHCTVEDMRKRASKRGVRVIIENVPDDDPLAGWVSARYSDEQRPAAYFAELTAKCSC